MWYPDDTLIASQGRVDALLTVGQKVKILSRSTVKKLLSLSIYIIFKFWHWPVRENLVKTKFEVFAIKQRHIMQTLCLSSPVRRVWNSWADLSVPFTEFKHKSLYFIDRRVRSRCLRKFMVTDSRESNALFSSLELLALAHEGKEQSYKGECSGVGDSLTELVRASAVMGVILHQTGWVSGRKQHL